MESQRECFKALDEDKTLEWMDGCLYKYISGVLCLKDTLENPWKISCENFMYPENFKIHTPQKWYEKLDGKKKIPCWVSDLVRVPNSSNTFKFITNYDASKLLSFLSSNSWKYATPLTKKEAQEILDNALEVEDD